MRRRFQWAGTVGSACWRWGPPIAWMAVIGGFSTDAFSASETGRLLMPILRWLLPGAMPSTLELLHAVLRKGMHVAEFGVLALLWYRALGWRGSGWQPKAALTALLVAAGVGVVDEGHQIFVPSRTASIMDVGWDSLGAALGLLGRWGATRLGPRGPARAPETQRPRPAFSPGAPQGSN